MSIQIFTYEALKFAAGIMFSEAVSSIMQSLIDSGVEVSIRAIREQLAIKGITPDDSFWATFLDELNMNISSRIQAHAMAGAMYAENKFVDPMMDRSRDIKKNFAEKVRNKGVNKALKYVAKGKIETRITQEQDRIDNEIRTNLNEYYTKRKVANDTVNTYVSGVGDMEQSYNGKKTDKYTGKTNNEKLDILIMDLINSTGHVKAV